MSKNNTNTITPVPAFDPALPFEKAAVPYRNPAKGSAKTIAIEQGGWLYTATGAPVSKGSIPAKKKAVTITGDGSGQPIPPRGESAPAQS